MQARPGLPGRVLPGGGPGVSVVALAQSCQRALRAAS